MTLFSQNGAPAQPVISEPLGVKWFLMIPVVAGLYFVAGKLGLSFAFVNNSTSVIWPPTGIALAALLMYGRRVWPGVFLGAFLVNVTTAGPLWTSVAIAAGNTLECVAGAYLVERFAGGAACFDRARSIFKFSGLAGLVGTTISATAGVSTLILSGSAETAQLGPIWLTWWLGDAVGALTITPLIVLWLRPQPMREPAGGIEILLMVGAVLAVGAAVFANPVGRHYPMAFLCIPALVWVAFRFGPRQLALAIVALMSLAVWATVNGRGPFALETQHASLLVLQAFMGTMSITMLVIASLVREREISAIAAAAANHARDESLAMLSHELRNPLQAISSAAAILRHPSHTAAMVSEAANTINRQTEHLARLVNDLLDVTRAIEGTTVLTREPVNVEQAINQCLQGLAQTGQTQNHKVNVMAQPVWVNADPVRFQQILRNLIVNALTYTPKGGVVRIHALRVEKDAVVQVIDEGIGISSTLLPRIFELFSQDDRNLDRQQGGLGIGLTLVRHLVEQHDGSVEGQSPGPGKGSVFTMKLPSVAPAPPKIVRTVLGTQSPTKRRRVLIVEDNPDARQALQMLLEMMGYEVFSSEDGIAGVEQALRVQPDIALVDIGLPRLDGYGVARELSRLDKRVRLIAVTGYGGEQDRQKAREAGFHDHLVKPVTIEGLQRAMTHPIAEAANGMH